MPELMQGEPAGGLGKDLSPPVGQPSLAGVDVKIVLGDGLGLRRSVRKSGPLCRWPIKRGSNRAVPVAQ